MQRLIAHCANNPVMYTDISGFCPSLFDLRFQYIPARRMIENIFVNNSFIKMGGIYDQINHPNTRQDYSVAWSVIGGLVYSTWMMSFYTAAGGLEALGISMFGSMMVGTVIYVVTAVVVAVIIYVVIEAISSTDANESY